LPFIPALALFALWLAGASLDLGPDWPLVQFVETLLWFLLSGILVALAVIVVLGFLWLRRTGALDAWRAERKFHRTGLLGDVVAVALRRNEMPDIRGRLAGRNDRATELARCELAL